jgi:hypothetical protein
MDEKKNELPSSYYSLHADELKLLQFLLYHLKYKTQNKKTKKRKGRFEIINEPVRIIFD